MQYDHLQRLALQVLTVNISYIARKKTRPESEGEEVGHPEQRAPVSERRLPLVPYHRRMCMMRAHMRMTSLLMTMVVYAISKLFRDAEEVFPMSASGFYELEESCR